MQKTKQIKLICFDEALRTHGAVEVVCSAAGPIAIAKEPAGRIFHETIMRQQGLIGDPAEAAAAAAAAAAAKAEAASPARASSASLDADQPPPGVSWKGKKRKGVKKREGQDLYALLGLQHERFTATENQLKNAYRRVCLEHHPDKRLAGVTDEEEKKRVEDYFKQIQEAYAVLSDPVKRREFDSTDEFDDSLPHECDPVDFFKVFGPAFRRNARWSVDSNVPDVGDENTAYEEVDKFYNFWFTFKSWREFPHPDEEDVECAESREHKRWIERQNSKLREKGKKDEGKRLREFVEAAYKIDPRVARRKEEERLEKERKKAEKEEARRRAAEEEAAKKAAEEAAKKAAAEEEKRKVEEARKARETAKRALKKERQRLRTLCEGGDGVERLVDADDVEKLTTKLEAEQLQALCDSMSCFGITREAQRETVLSALSALMQQEEDSVRQKEAQKKEAEAAIKAIARRDHERKVAAMREWDDEELRMLDKAVAKFPQGTPKRWEAVAAYVRTRTLDEVLLMVKEKQGAAAARVRAQEDYRSGIKKKAEVKADADLRINAFSDVNVNLIGEAATTLAAVPGAPAAPAPAAQQQPAAASSATSTAASSPRTASSSGQAAPAAKTAAAPAAAAKPKAPATAPAGQAAAAAAAPAAPAPAAGDGAAGKKVVSSESGEWSEAQELALVQALKQFGKELPDRWERVSSAVPGKSKAQCFKRFKELREVFRTKKTAGGDEE